MYLPVNQCNSWYSNPAAGVHEDDEKYLEKEAFFGKGRT